MTEDYDDMVYRLQTLHQQKQQRETVDAMNEAADAITKLRQRIKVLEDALRWYGEQARRSRFIYYEWDDGHNPLADDGGRRARAALGGDDE